MLYLNNSITLLLQCFKSINLLKIYTNNWNIENSKINIVLNKKTNESIDENVLKNIFSDYFIIGNINFSKIYNTLINKNMNKNYLNNRVKKEYKKISESILKENNIDATIIEGGAERYLSVKNAIKKIDHNYDVLIHDCARPLTSIFDIEKLIESTTLVGTLYHNVSDTVKLVDGNTKTVDRSKLFAVTTPQYFSKDLFSKMGVSTDWDIHYKTVSPSTIKISQLSFIELVEKGHCYHKESPALWCNECLTSIAQAELETKTIKTTFNYITFSTVEDGEKFTIATTRPELLPAIVCVFVNPEDEARKHLIGKTARIPVINVEVPIMADEKVAIDKGTGVVMCCTFGDQTDIEWWKKYNLPLKHIFTTDGRIVDSVPNYGGLKIKEARAKVIEDLQNAGVVEKIEELEHEVQTHERCGREVEYSVMKQWFIDIMNHKKDFIKIGNEIKWNPSHMHNRYKTNKQIDETYIEVKLTNNKIYSDYIYKAQIQNNIADGYLVKSKSPIFKWNIYIKILIIVLSEILIFPYMFGAIINYFKNSSLIKKLDNHMMKLGYTKIKESEDELC